MRRAGCLTGCFTQLLALFIGGSAVAIVLYALLAPYNFYYGGHFHWWPGWQGQGWIHSPLVGDYFLWIRIDPSTPAYRKSDIDATGYLCTPTGERFRLVIGGDWPRSHPTNTVGVPVRLYMHERASYIQTLPSRLSLEFYGAFADRALVLEDRGSLPTAFRQDGTLYGPHDHQLRRSDRVRFTLDESTPWTLFGPSCPPRRE